MNALRRLLGLPSAADYRLDPEPSDAEVHALDAELGAIRLGLDARRTDPPIYRALLAERGAA